MATENTKWRCRLANIFPYSHYEDKTVSRVPYLYNPLPWNMVRLLNGMLVLFWYLWLPEGCEVHKFVVDNKRLSKPIMIPLNKYVLWMSVIIKFNVWIRMKMQTQNMRFTSCNAFYLCIWWWLIGNMPVLCTVSITGNVHRPMLMMQILLVVVFLWNPPFTKELGHPQFWYHTYWEVISRIYAT